VFAHLHPHPPNADQLVAVHPQSVNGRSACSAEPGDFGSIYSPLEVVFPSVSMRMKQRNLFTSRGVFRDSAIGLVSIAGGAAKTDILEDRPTTGRPRSNVLALEDRDGQVLSSTAVGTAECEMLSDTAP
jgi:hypothetical protein